MFVYLADYPLVTYEGTRSWWRPTLPFLAKLRSVISARVNRAVRRGVAWSLRDDLRPSGRP